MTWWFKHPCRAGQRPPMLRAGFPGFLAWLALIDIDQQEDFEGQIPEDFTDPVFLARQFPPTDGPSAEVLASGLDRLIAAGLASRKDSALVLDATTYAEWRGADSGAKRQRKYRSKSRHVTESDGAVTDSDDEVTPSLDEVTRVTLPDQTRPDLDQSVVTRRTDPGQLVDELFAHYLAVCKSSAPAAQLKRPTLLATRHVILEAINHPRIREASPEEIQRAIDTLAIQGKAKADAGEDDPWWPLRSAWSVNVLAEALSMPDEKTARTRAVRQSRAATRPQNLPTSVEPRSAEDFARYEDEQ